MLVRMAAIKRSTNNKCWRGCGEKGTLLPCWWECKLVQPLWRTVWRFLKKLEIELPYDAATPLLGTHTKETRIERDTCTPVFIAALFTIARTWKQPRCPSHPHTHTHTHTEVAQLCPTLCDPMDCSPPGSSIHGIFQAWILEWVAVSFSRCPSADGWIRKLWCIYTMEYYSAIKKNTFESDLMMWVKLEPFIQSEVSQKEKHQYSILMHIYGI